MTLDEIIGQQVPVSILQQSLATNTLGHAYLFFGERGVGKETTARALADELLKAGGPHSELHVLQGEDSIGIDKIRELRFEAVLSSKGNKIWLIINAERMTPEASNAFLKTLEEPGERTYFILTTTKPNQLLPTILSRCQQIAFRNIPEQAIALWLSEKTGLAAEEPEIISVARLAQGSFAKAWEYWDGDLASNRKEILGKLIKIPTATYPEVLGISQAWTEDRIEISRDMQLFLGWFRDLLLVKNELDLPLYNPDYKKELEKMAAYYTNYTLFEIIEQITDMNEAIKGNARIRFHLGYLLLLIKRGALL